MSVLRVVGLRGIRRDIAPHDMPQDSLYDVRNMEADRFGRLRVIKGRKPFRWNYQDDARIIRGIEMVWWRDSSGNSHSELAVSANERTDIVRETEVYYSLCKFGTSELYIPRRVQIVPFRPGLAFKTVGVSRQGLNGTGTGNYALAKIMLPTDSDAVSVEDSVAGVPPEGYGSSPVPNLTFTTESGNVPAGTWNYAVAFYNSKTGALGEIVVQTPLVLTEDSKVTIDDIPTYAVNDGQRNYIYRKILRRQVTSDGVGDWYVIGTIENNTDTTYVDNLKDHTTGTLYEEDKVGTPPYGDTIAVWLGRLWIGSGETLYYSEADLPEQVPATNQIAVGSNIKALVATTGSLYIFCEEGIYRIPYAEHPEQFRLVKETDVGCAYLQAAVGLGNLMAFANKDGIWLFDGRNPTLISEPVRDLISAADPVEVGLAFDSIRAHLHVFMGRGYTTGNLYLVYDLRRRAWFRRDDRWAARGGVTANANGAIGFFAYMAYAVWQENENSDADISSATGTVTDASSNTLTVSIDSGEVKVGALVECNEQVRLITQWDSVSGVMTVSPSWDSVPSQDSTWTVGKLYAYAQTPFLAAKNPFEQVILNEVRWQPDSVNDLELYINDDETSPAVSVSDVSVAYSFDVAARSHSVRIKYDGDPEGWTLDEILLKGTIIRRE